MIESITISKAASFTGNPQVLDGLSKFNYFFGTNGTGKTTIGRVISDPSQFFDCSIRWRGNTSLETLVYNQDYIKENFDQSPRFKGIFTLGKEQKDTAEKIGLIRDEIDKLDRELIGLNKKLGGDGQGENTGKRGKLHLLEDNFKEKCWRQKQKHDEAFKVAFRGVRNNSENFKKRVLDEHLNNAAKLQTLTYLREKAAQIFDKSPVIVEPICKIDFSKLISYESAPILKKVIVGREHLDIAKLIQKLNNSDWVKEGMIYYQSSEGLCPFCQQQTNAELAKDLNDYFDETFRADTKLIDELNLNYVKEAATTKALLEEVITAGSPYLDLRHFRVQKDVFDSLIRTNKQKLTAKQEKVSQVIELDSLKKVASEITRLISEANGKIKQNNEIVTNFHEEKTVLTEEVWKHVLAEIEDDLIEYEKGKDNLQKAIKGIEKRITENIHKVEQKKAELRRLERQSTSTVPTRDSINSLLESFGFNNFRLEIVDDSNYYKLVRPDGANASDTLSEGERSFVTFLYFYHSLQGSENETGTITDRVVVFDDPVSSLDSDVLFIVSSLIKGLMAEMRNGSSHIKQLFILTHNVYFHKEVTFNKNRRDRAMNEESFWLVRKPESISVVERKRTNPIKTSYELLWSEVRNNDRPVLTIQNTLRRIVENYFIILGGQDPDKICAKFKGKGKLICRSLFSWMHDGSHSALDELYISVNEDQVELFIKVFKQIFKNEGQIAHYNMMMGLDE